ncbi:MAG: glycosyltransferase family 39 protein [archaeon]
MVTETDKNSTLAARKTKLADKISLWFKDPYNKALFGVFFIAIALRLFYFFITKTQPLWWDEAEYMMKSKRIAFDLLSWQDYWGPRKPILLAWVFVPFFKLGISEVVMRFTLALMSILGVYSSYLVAKEFFDKKVALIATAIMSVFWVGLFFTGRFLVEMPATPFFMFALYFFSKGYIKKESPKYVWLFGIFFTIGFLMRVSYGIFLIPIVVYLLLEDNLKIILKKDLWIAVILGFIVALPFFIYLFNTFPDDPLGRFIGAKYGRFSFGQEHGSMGWPGVPLYFKELPNVMGAYIPPTASYGNIEYYFASPFFLLMVAGFAIFFMDLLLGLDLLFKKEYTGLRVKIMIIIWILIAMVAFGLTRSYVEQRDTLPIAIFFFSFAAMAIIRIQDYIGKFNKTLGVLFVIGVIVLGAIPQLTYAYALTISKVDSYGPVKDAALWIKQNSQPRDIVFTMSSPQNQYYSDRETYSFSGMGLEEFEGNFTTRKPKYLILSAFEPYWLNQKFDFNQWIQNNSNRMSIPVEPWYSDPATKQQPVLIIYQINWDNNNTLNNSLFT